MSHFTVVEIEATDASCLIEALEALGYEGKIEVDDRPVILIGYDGRPRLLDGQEVRAENVIGFARQPTAGTSPTSASTTGVSARRGTRTWSKSTARPRPPKNSAPRAGRSRSRGPRARSASSGSDMLEHCAICFTADGRAIGVYSDAMPWASLGRILAMPSASHVEFDTAQQQWAARDARSGRVVAFGRSR